MIQESFYPVPRGIAMGAARVKPPPETKPSDFNKGDFKPKSTYQELPFKVGKPDFPERITTTDAYFGIQARAVFGPEAYRHPESYNIYDLKGVPRMDLDPFIPNTRHRRLNAFEATYKVQEKIAPEQKLAEAIPIAHAKHQRALEEKELAKAKLNGYADEIEQRDARERNLVDKMNKNVLQDHRYVNIAAKLDGY